MTNTFRATLLRLCIAFTLLLALSLPVYAAAVAQIGETTYDSLQAAIAAVQDGETITLLHHTDLGSLALDLSATTDANNVTEYNLDLNEYVIKSTNAYAARLGSPITVNISAAEDGGILGDSDYALLVSNIGAIVTIDGGEYWAEDDAILCSAGSVVIYAGDFKAYTDSGMKGCLVVDGGSITLATHSVALQPDWQSVVYKQIVVVRAEAETGGVYYATLQEAIAAVAEGGTVNLIRNLEDSDEQIDLGSNVPSGVTEYTLNFGEYTITGDSSSSMEFPGAKMQLISPITVHLTATTGGIHSSRRQKILSVWKDSNAKVTIDGGTYTSKMYTVSSENGAGVEIVTGVFNTLQDSGYAFYTQTSGTITIASGSVADPADWATATPRPKTVTVTKSTAPVVKPTITTTQLPPAAVGAYYTTTIEASGTAPFTWFVRLDTFPAGLTLDTATGVITGTPTTAKTYNFQITATNSADEDRQAYSFTIGQPVAQIDDTLYATVQDAINAVKQGETITLLSDISVASGDRFDLGTAPYAHGVTEYTVDLTTYTVTRTSGEAYSLFFLGKPITVNLNATTGGTSSPGAISSINVNGAGAVLHINGGNHHGRNEAMQCLDDALVVISAGIFTATALENDGCLMTNHGGSITIAPGSTAVPADWNTTTPKANTVAVTKNAAVGTPPTITTSSNIDRGFVNVPYSFTFTADGDKPITWDLVPYPDPLPAGLSLNPNTGVLSGIPTEYGNFYSKIIASNAYATTLQYSFTFQISNPAAETGGNYYNSLQEAINAVANNGTVTLLRDVDLSLESIKFIDLRSQPVLKGVSTYTLNLGNYTVSGANAGNLFLLNADNQGSAFHVRIVAKAGGISTTGACALSVTGARSLLTIDGGTYSGTEDAMNVKSGSVVLATGTFIATVDSSGDGCLFVGTDGNISLAPGSLANPANWATAPSKTVVVQKAVAKIGTTYHATLEDAIASVEDGETITLLQNIALADTVDIDLGATTDANGVLGYTLVLGEFTISGNATTPGLLKLLSDIQVTVKATTGGVTNASQIALGVNSENAKLAIEGGSYTSNHNAVSCQAGAVIISEGHFVTQSEQDGVSSLFNSYAGQIRFADDSIAEPATWQESFAKVITVRLMILPIITTQTLIDGRVNVPYSAKLTAVGDEPMTWNIQSGDLPSGLILGASTGTIAGTPLQVGSHVFTVKASNPLGNSSKELSIVILPPVYPIYLFNSNVHGHVPFEGSLSNPADAEAGQIINLPALAPKAGFVFVTWEVDAGSVNLINATSATNASFTMGNAEVRLNAVFAAAPLTFADQTLPSGTVGAPYTQNVTAPTGGSGNYSYTATLPSGFTLSPTGILSGTPTTTLANHTFDLTVTDTLSGATATASYTLSVGAAASYTSPNNYYGGNTSSTTTKPTEETKTDPVKPADNAPASVANEGWDKMTELAQNASDGDSIIISMDGTTLVPAELLNALAGKDVDVTFVISDGLSWTVNGSDIPSDTTLQALNLGVTTEGNNLMALVQNIDGSESYVQLNISYDGNFQFPMTLAVALDAMNAGFYANLYYFNEETGALEFVTAALIDEAGDVEFPMTHASTYAILVSSIKHSTTMQVVTPDTTIPNPDDDTDYPIILTIGSTVVTQGDAILEAPPVPAQIIGDRAMLPMRYLTQTLLGGTVHWEEATRTIYAEVNGVTFEMTIDDTTYIINGEPVYFEESPIAPVIVNDHTLIPIRIFEYTSVRSVQWDGTAQTVSIYP